jgi:hypothetical protein
MDGELTKSIAEAVSKQVYHDMVPVWLLQTLVVAAIAAAASFCGSYFKEKGKNLATKSDFDELSRQLSENTKIVETVKSDLARRDWAEREWSNLRRIKLEELLTKIDAAYHYRSQERSQAINKIVVYNPDPMESAFVLVQLYFPELDQSFAQLRSKHHQDVAESASLLGELISLREPAEWQGIHDKYAAKRDLLGISNSTIDVSKKARELLKSIILIESKANAAMTLSG